MYGAYIKTIFVASGYLLEIWYSNRMEESTINERRKKGLKQIGIGVVVLIVVLIAYYYQGKEPELTVQSFAECAAAGFPVMESYPRQCRTQNGQTFREDIGNELEKDNLIRVESPRPNTEVTSPLALKGMARGNWFFEASFPVKLLDASGTEIAQGVAQAKGEWMTTEFVPFEATLTFTEPVSGSGTLLLGKDNPSGLPEHADELRIPVTFLKQAAPVPPATKACIVTGCSGQVCSDEEIITTCEYRAEHACYKQARCERQPTGKCGWTETTALRACVNRNR